MWKKLLYTVAVIGVFVGLGWLSRLAPQAVVKTSCQRVIVSYNAHHWDEKFCSLPVLPRGYGWTAAVTRHKTAS